MVIGACILSLVIFVIGAILGAASSSSAVPLAGSPLTVGVVVGVLPTGSVGRTLKAWRQQVLAYFDTSGVSTGGTEAINLIIEKVRRLAHGFRDFTHYRLRILLAASNNRGYRR
jgi:Transposase